MTSSNIVKYIIDNSKSINFICDASIIIIFNVSILIRYGFLFYIPLLIYMTMDEQSAGMKYFIYTYLTILSYFDISVFIIFICLNISSIIITFNYSTNEEIKYFMNVVKSLTNKLNELIKDENVGMTSAKNKDDKNNEDKENTNKISSTKNFIHDSKPLPFSSTLNDFCSNCNNVRNNRFKLNKDKDKTENKDKDKTENNINVDSSEHQNKSNENILLMNKEFEIEYNKQLDITPEEKERIKKENIAKVQKYFEEQQKKRKEEEEKFKEYEKELRNRNNKNNKMNDEI